MNFCEFPGNNSIANAVHGLPAEVQCIRHRTGFQRGVHHVHRRGLAHSTRKTTSTGRAYQVGFSSINKVIFLPILRDAQYQKPIFNPVVRQSRRDVPKTVTYKIGDNPCVYFFLLIYASLLFFSIVIILHPQAAL